MATTGRRERADTIRVKRDIPWAWPARSAGSGPAPSRGQGLSRRWRRVAGEAPASDRTRAERPPAVLRNSIAPTQSKSRAAIDGRRIENDADHPRLGVCFGVLLAYRGPPPHRYAALPLVQWLGGPHVAMSHALVISRSASPPRSAHWALPSSSRGRALFIAPHVGRSFSD